MNNKGFTLIEIILTIGLLVLIGMIAIPSVQNINYKKQINQCNKLKDLTLEKAVVYVRVNNINLPTTIHINDLVNSNLFDTNTQNQMFESVFLNDNANIEIVKNSEGIITATMEGNCAS